MAGTVTVERKPLFDQGWSRGVDVIKWTWSTGAGDTTAVGGGVPNVSGRIMGIKAVPSTVDQPADDYDVTIVDKENGMDVLNGAGVDLPQAATSIENIRIPIDFKQGGNVPLMNEYLSFSGSGLGNSAAGAFYMWVEMP